MNLKLFRPILLMALTLNFIVIEYYFDYIYAQQQQQLQPPVLGIKVISPNKGQQVPAGQLMISGISTDNTTSDCTVYADWNNLKPFQKAVATGSGGVNDYSTWKFTYTDNYHLITNGINKLTSKLSCINNSSRGTANLTTYYSINVTGIMESSQRPVSSSSVAQQPIIHVPNLKVEEFVKGLSFPTSMAFIDKNNIMVLEKNNGQVRLISNGILQEQPILEVQVENKSERGLLGIATINDDSEIEGSSSINEAIGTVNQAAKTIFLYYTESESLRNRVYRYQWNGETLVNSTLILDLPAEPGPNHDGGKIAIGPDQNLYAIIGDLNHNGKLQNMIVGPELDDTSVILRVNPNDDSLPANNNPLSSNNNTNSNENSTLSRYYAYGIRNSFGMDFDPITGALWDTENGPDSFDEINLVNPGFNSGWKKVMGPISRSNITENELLSFPGSNYADPVFSWNETIGVTDIEFLNSSKLGDEYKNNIFIGDIKSGNLYYFEVNEKRDGLKFNDSQSTNLTDLVADNKDESSEVIFGTGFGSKRGITDIETGPDGLLYIVSFNKGTIYRIAPLVNSSSSDGGGGGGR
jgi:aldose sugar dehydrogenase